MTEQHTQWRKYEEVAAFLLSQMVEEFGLDRIEEKQKITGLRSGTEWEIDAKGVAGNGEMFVIVECRRYTSSRLDQESLGALAYRIWDTGAVGGIVVSPLGLQEGAARVAQSNHIVSVLMDPESTTSDYVLRFLNMIKVGCSGELRPKGTLAIKVIRKDGSVEEF